MIVKLLCKHGADVNKHDMKTGRTPLHICICEQQLAILEFLLSTAVDIEKTDFNGWSPATYAKQLLDASNPVTNDIYSLLCKEMVSSLNLLSNYTTNIITLL